MKPFCCLLSENPFFMNSFANCIYFCHPSHCSLTFNVASSCYKNSELLQFIDTEIKLCRKPCVNKSAFPDVSLVSMIIF